MLIVIGIVIFILLVGASGFFSLLADDAEQRVIATVISVIITFLASMLITAEFQHRQAVLNGHADYLWNDSETQRSFSWLEHNDEESE